MQKGTTSQEGKKVHKALSEYSYVLAAAVITYLIVRWSLCNPLPVTT